MMDCELFRINAGAHHFVNVFFHALNVALLFGLLFQLSKKLWPSAIVAALFAWHPLHVESVAWVAERKDVLSTFFALLALGSYAKCHKVKNTENPQFYWLTLFFFECGLMAKPMLVTMPVLLLLLDFWPLARIQKEQLKTKNFWPAILEKTPFFLLTIVSCVITFVAQHRGEAVVSLTSVPLLYRLENTPVAMVGYLQNLIWPTQLCAIYPMPHAFSALKLASAVFLLILISIAAWRWRQTKPYFITGWLWFLGTLIPVIGLVQVGGQAMADRYTYLPSIGFFFASVFFVAELAEKTKAPKIILTNATAVILLACIFATEKQIQFWRDSETLFRHAVAVTKNNDIALINLGSALEAQGKYEAALACYHQAEKIDAQRFQLHNNLGNILGILGRHEESLVEYREASRLRPDAAFPHNGAGLEFSVLKKWNEALLEFAEAARLNPDFAAPHLETGKILLKLKRDAEAASELRLAAKLDADNFQTLASVAHFLAASDDAIMRNGAEALLFALQASELSGHQQPMVYDILGMAFAASGDFTNAQTCAKNALDLATSAQMKNTEPIQQRLELYQKNQPWRESFSETNASVKP